MKYSEEEIAKLWEKFNLSKEPKIKNILISHYVWLVKYVIKQMNLPQSTILANEDYVNIGILGLNEAIERYEYNRGIKFESYSVPRIRGTIQDELRKLDWLSRTTRKKVQEFNSANDQLRLSEGREVSQEEIRKKLNVSQEQYESYLTAVAAAKASLSLGESGMIIQDNEEIDILESVSYDDDENTLDKMVDVEKMDYISEYLSKLNEKKRLVMSLYYYEELTFKEIGLLVNVSESRVCQIHTEVVNDLRIKLKQMDYA
jgi:RNA polymerase sigma factor for flagellar operon FliA